MASSSAFAIGTLRVMAARVGALRQYSFRLGADPDLLKERGHHHARPFAAHDQSMRVLYRELGTHVFPVLRVAGAFEEIDARYGREAHQVVHGEHQRPLAEAVDHQSMLGGVILGTPP